MLLSTLMEKMAGTQGSERSRVHRQATDSGHRNSARVGNGTAPLPGLLNTQPTGHQTHVLPGPRGPRGPEPPPSSPLRPRVLPVPSLPGGSGQHTVMDREALAVPLGLQPPPSPQGSYLEGFMLGSFRKDKYKRKKMSMAKARGHRSPGPGRPSFRTQDSMLVPARTTQAVSAWPGARWAQQIALR